MLGLVLCCAMTASVFTSCGSDDDPAGSGDDTTPARVRVAAVFPQAEAVLRYCDVKVEYDDGTGTKTEIVTSPKWEKTLEAKLPATITFKRTVTLKTDVTPSSTESITFDSTCSDGSCLLNAAGNPLTNLSIGKSSSTKTLNGEKFIEYVESGRLDKTITYSFDANGNKK